MPTEKFAVKVKKLREKRGWTQEQLAEVLGVDKGTVSRWERDEQLAVRAVIKLIDRLLEEEGESYHGRKQSQAQGQP